MFGRVRDFFFGTHLRRLIFAMAAAGWFGSILVTVPDPGWTALTISPFLVGALVIGTLVRSWWALPICVVIYFLGAAAATLWWIDETDTTYSMLAFSALMLGAGIATIEVISLIRGESKPAS